MTTITLPRAVVEQALEALELGYDAAKSEADQYHAAMAGFRPERHAQMDADVQQIAAAITALRAALAQQAEPVEPVAWGWVGDPSTQDYASTQPDPVEPVEPYCYVYEYDGVFGLHREFYPVPYNGMKPSRTVPVYTAPPRQAEPVEPVAWMYTGIKQDGTEHGPHLVWQPECMDAMSASRGAKAAPLYTAPPQRKPLMEGALMGVYIDFDRAADPAWSKAEYLLHFARAVERAHGITDPQVKDRLACHGIPMPEAPACPDCHGIGYDASGQTCACQENPSF